MSGGPLTGILVALYVSSAVHCMPKSRRMAQEKVYPSIEEASSVSQGELPEILSKYIFILFGKEL